MMAKAAGTGDRAAGLENWLVGSDATCFIWLLDRFECSDAVPQSTESDNRSLCAVQRTSWDNQQTREVTAV
jgi:hypothetical protein